MYFLLVIVNIYNFEYDIGNFINHEKWSDEIIYKALNQPCVPESSYNFKKDSSEEIVHFAHSG